MNKTTKIGHLNCISIRNKILDIIELINTEKIYILYLNETHLNSSDHHLHSISGFNIIRNDRTHSRGGGVAIIIKKQLKYKIINKVSSNDSEFITIEIRHGTSQLKIMATYLQPKSKSNLNFVNDLVINNNNAIILGDFNAHNSL